jgi:hypothetical protein
MRLKIHLKGHAGRPALEGIPDATLVTAPEHADGHPPQVVLFISAVHPLTTDVIGWVRMTPREARELAARLVKSAENAEP